MLTLILALQVIAGQGAAPSGADRRDIVVTATRLEDSERAWKACRARRCPPDAEIRAALAHGENLFVAGHYRRAQSTLATTIGSTRGAERRFPVLVGDLRRAEARVSTHMGETDIARRGMAASRDALAAGLGNDAAQALAQRLLTADAMMIEGPLPNQPGSAFTHRDRREVALRTYESVAADARRLDLPDLEGRALMRRAALFARLALAEPFSYSRKAKDAVRRIAETTDPRLAVYRDAAAMLGARMTAATGDEAAVERLVASYRGGGGAAGPILIYAPPVILSASRDRTASAVRRAALRGGDQPFNPLHRDEWVDVSFYVGDDGRVSDVEIVRASEGRTGDWVDPVLAAIRGRRYAVTAAAGEVGRMRVERHTYTASWSQPTGGRIRVQTGVPRVVMLDLTADSPTRSAPRPAGAVPAPTG